MVRASIICLLFIFSFSCFSQTTETIVSGRPGQAIAPVCVGKNVFQIETGFDFAGVNYTDEITKEPTYGIGSYLNATLLRFGLGERVEIHSGWEFRNDSYSNRSATRDVWDSTISGISFSSIGWRFTIMEGDGLRPAIAYQYSMKLNLLSEEYKLNNIAPNMNLAISSGLTDNLGVTINLGCDWDGENPKPTGFYIFNIGYSLGDKFGVFVENYGSFQSGLLDTKFDGGLAFLLNNDLQLDLLGGYGSYKGTSSWFASLGISWRVNFSKKKEVAES